MGFLALSSSVVCPLTFFNGFGKFSPIRAWPDVIGLGLGVAVNLQTFWPDIIGLGLGVTVNSQTFS